MRMILIAKWWMWPNTPLSAFSSPSLSPSYPTTAKLTLPLIDSWVLWPKQSWYILTYANLQPDYLVTLNFAWYQLDRLHIFYIHIVNFFERKSQQGWENFSWKSFDLRSESKKGKEIHSNNPWDWSNRMVTSSVCTVSNHISRWGTLSVELHRSLRTAVVGLGPAQFDFISHLYTS